MNHSFSFQDIEISLTTSSTQLTDLFEQAFKYIEDNHAQVRESAEKKVRIYCRLGYRSILVPVSENEQLIKNKKVVRKSANWTTEPVHTPVSRPEIIELRMDALGAVAKLHPVADGTSIMIDWTLPAESNREGPSQEDVLYLVENVLDLILLDTQLTIEGSTISGSGPGWPTAIENIILVGDPKVQNNVIRSLQDRYWEVISHGITHVAPTRRGLGVVDTIPVEQNQSSIPQLYPVFKIIHLVEAHEAEHPEPRNALLEALNPHGDHSNLEAILKTAFDKLEIYKVVWHPEALHAASRCVLEILGFDKSPTHTPKIIRNKSVSEQVSAMRKG